MWQVLFKSKFTRLERYFSKHSRAFVIDSQSSESSNRDEKSGEWEKKSFSKAWLKEGIEETKSTYGNQGLIEL